MKKKKLYLDKIVWKHDIIEDIDMFDSVKMV